MRNYEAMILIRPGIDEETYTAVVDKFSNLITQQGGELVKVEKWGKRRLQYEINRHKEAFYLLVYFKGEPAVSQELERVMKISDDIIRFLVIRKED
ncbi:30S ribosomal protein S6 [Heliophilum fasciatum]|uniref:Small ribosomal subunit protein bS6 n=1 Tax=Heliophilum fasciatum TaxID=35700 RepID=A0A4R2S0I1_9FIRM|nr:30S ribosomal protein S6 [Heliophilum fasciatum]MCW2276690.1 small subunit ribosomal protein S6 [Heliophilum fasciatum]TCP68929.1 SSU ribosomal protein S6P [Heliophilum fasciatum]